MFEKQCVRSSECAEKATVLLVCLSVDTHCINVLLDEVWCSILCGCSLPTRRELCEGHMSIT